MPRISIPITGVDADSRAQLEYALTFASEDIASYKINEGSIEADVSTEAACEAVSRKIRELVERYQAREFGLPKTVEFKQERDLQMIDAWSGLLERKWVTPVGEGHVILRGTAAELLSLIDAKVDGIFVRSFEAEREFYPATILCKTLDRIHHFTSFPEHIDFVAHLRGDLDVLNKYSGECREQGWSPALNEGRMGENDFAICPSCCYHCYEGMENWQLDPPGRCTFAVRQALPKRGGSRQGRARREGSAGPRRGGVLRGGSDPGDPGPRHGPVSAIGRPDRCRLVAADLLPCLRGRCRSARRCIVCGRLQPAGRAAPGTA